MAAEECFQETTTFQEVSVSLTEEKELTLDPYLFALSGNNIQQYCTILSLLELEKSKPEMFLETPQGTSVPLSLVQVAEEFEVLQGDDSTLQTKLHEPLLQGSGSGPLVRMQYDFVPERSVQGNPPGSLSASLLQQETETWSSDLVSLEENCSKSSKPLQAQPAREGLMRDISATIPQQEGLLQPVAISSHATEQNDGTVPQGFEQSHPQEVLRSDKLLESSSLKEGRDTGEKFLCTGEKTCPSGNFQESRLNDSVSSLVYEETQTRLVSELCPTCGRKLELKLNPTAFQLATSEKVSFGCPDCGRSFSCSTAGLTEYQLIPTKEWDRLLRQLNLGHRPHQKDVTLEKPFKCQDCGKGFLRRSSIPKHRKLHRKENSSAPSEQERSLSLSMKPFSHPKPHSGKEKPFQLPPDGKGQISGSAKKPSDLCSQSTSTLSSGCAQIDSLVSEPCRNQADAEKPFCCSDCGKRFSVKKTMIRHQMLHQQERPFKCLHCDKSYIQKSHLKRHDQKKHSNLFVLKEGTSV